MAIYLPYIFNNNNTVLGHYRAMNPALATTSGVPAANSIWWSGIYGGPNLAVITRFAMAVEVTTAKAVASPFDFAMYLFRGATGKASGTGTVVLTLGGQQMRPNMAPTQWSNGSNGEMRTIGGSLTAGIVAATGKANSSSPIGGAVFNPIYSTTATGTATALPVGANVGSPAFQDLYTLQPGVTHPITLGTNDGLEVQRITAGATTADISCLFLLEWAECLSL
jgi:hypothetical protein